MKKAILILFFAIAALLLALPWYVGAELEKRLPDVIARGAQEAQRYGLGVQLRNYRRGWMTSQAQMLVLYQPPGEQVPLYQGLADLDIHHAPVFTSGFDVMRARLRSDDDAQGALAQALPGGFLDVNAAVGADGALQIEGRLREADTTLQTHPNRPQHLAFHGAQFAVSSTLTGYPERGRGALELAGLTFTDGDQRWHLSPVQLTFAAEDAYEAQAHIPELILQHSIHALGSREQIRLRDFRARMEQGLSAQGNPYPHSLDYHIADLQWTHERQGQTQNRHLHDLNMNMTLRQHALTPGAALRFSGRAQHLDLPGGWQDIAPDRFESLLELQPFRIEQALALLDALRHPLSKAQYVPLPDNLSHVQLPAGAAHILHYLAALMAKEEVTLQGGLRAERAGETLATAQWYMHEHMQAANGTEILQQLADAVGHNARLPALLHGSRVHLAAARPFVQKSGLGLSLIFAGQQHFLDENGQFKLDALIDKTTITVNGALVPLRP